MKVVKPLLVILVLLLFASAATTAWAKSEDRRRQAAEDGIETGGWQVAYSDEMTEDDAAQGMVAPGVSIYTERGSRGMGAVHDWADSLVRQALALLPRRVVRELDRKEEFQARRFTVRTIRELLRSQIAGEEIMELGTLEIKAGLMEYRSKDRSRRGDRDRWENRRRSEQIFVPYVGILAKDGRPSHRWNRDDRDKRHSGKWTLPDDSEDDSPVTIQESFVFPPVVGQILPHQVDAAEVFNGLSLANTAHQLDKKRWKWTAYIDGPTSYLQRISSVIYYLHPSFNPNVQQGDSSKPGHPITATGWGVFQLRAEVTLDDGNKRIYEHMLQF